MTAPISASGFVRLLDKRLHSVARKTYKDLPKMNPRLYHMMKTNSAWTEFWEMGQIPDITEFNGKLTTLGLDPGFHQKIEPKEYGNKVQIQRKILDDDQYGMLTNLGSDLMEAAVRTQEKLGAEPFAYAFSSAFTFQTSEEGVALCSDSHTTKSTVSTATGFDNLGTDTFSKSAIAAARIAIAGFKNNIGERIDIPQDLALVVPTFLHDQAMEITGSTLDPESANNTINVHKGRYEVIEYPRLDDYDTNNWFMVVKSRMKRDLLWVDRIKPELQTNWDFDTHQHEIGIYFRCGNGFKNWRWVYGSQVS